MIETPYRRWQLGIHSTTRYGFRQDGYRPNGYKKDLFLDVFAISKVLIIVSLRVARYTWKKR